MSKLHTLIPANARLPSDARSEAIMMAIETLIDGLSPLEKEQLLRKVTEKLHPIPVPRAGDVLSVVVQLLPRDREWTVKELKQRVGQHGAPVTDKELHNAIGYLARKQHIQRLGHGRYMINGVAVVTGDEFGGQPSITEGDSDD